MLLMSVQVYAKAGYHAVYAVLFALTILDIIFRVILIEKKDAARYSESGANDNHSPYSKSKGGNSTPKPQVNVRQGDDATTRLPTNPEAEQQSQSSSSNTTEGEVQSETIPSRSFQLPTTVILLKSPRLLAALYGIFVNFALLACFDAILPLYVTRVFGWAPLGSGSIFLCVALPSLGAPLAGMVSDRYGPRWITVCGFILTAPPLVLLRLITHNSLGQIVLLCALLTLSGKT